MEIENEFRNSSESESRQFLMNKIAEIQQEIQERLPNLLRLKETRRIMNNRVAMLRDEFMVLEKPAYQVGEVEKMMGQEKTVVKIGCEGRYLVKAEDGVDKQMLKPGVRVALQMDSYKIHKILPSKVDPTVSMMMVDKAPDTTYEMVGGLADQVEQIKEIIELPMKHPEIFESLGITAPKGVLLYGPPGTGKTLLARAVANHTNCSFIRVSGSELVQKYIGEGARMVRELFSMARERSPAIIFMDEIDSIGSTRTSSGRGDGEVQRTMLELLTQLDGFESTSQIKVIMATNRLDILDSALLRPGRIDRKIEFPAPNAEARHAILKIHSRKMNFCKGIDLKEIAVKMAGASGAEMKGVCTEAGMLALRETRLHVSQEDFELAVSKIMKTSNNSVSNMMMWK